MDSLEILLTYPSRLLKLTAVHQDKLRPLLDGEPEFSVDPQKGTLIYRAHFKDPVKTMNLPALTLVWEPLTPANQAKIEPCIDRFYSSVSWKGANLASGLMGSAGAVSGAKVQILAAGADASGLNDATVRSAGMFVGGMALTPNYEALQLKLDGFKDQAGLRPPTLWMNQPKAEMLQPGRVLMIDLGVDNPDGVVFDEIRAAAEYDPSAVEVIDSDKRNWIGKGINLLDGPFHREWPWDLHFANRVDPQRGLFYYHMGMTDLREQPSRAFARLFVRIKKPVQAPIFQWIWTRSADPDEPTTGIYLFNRNIYLKDQKPETRLEDLTASGERADPKVYEF